MFSMGGNSLLLATNGECCWGGYSLELMRHGELSHITDRKTKEQDRSCKKTWIVFEMWDFSFREQHGCKPHIKMSFLHLAMHNSIPKLISLGIYDDSLSHRETKKVESPLNNLSHKFWNMCAPLHHLLNTHLSPGYKSKKLHLSKWASPSNVFVFLNFGLVIYLEHKWTRAILHTLFYL